MIDCYVTVSIVRVFVKVSAVLFLDALRDLTYSVRHVRTGYSFSSAFPPSSSPPFTSYSPDMSYEDGLAF